MASETGIENTTKEQTELVSDAWAFGFIAIGIVILLLSFYLGWLFRGLSCVSGH